MVKGQFKDLTGNRYGRLVAVERTGVNKFGKAVWKCQCDCGNVTTVSIAQLSTGQTLSCGCLHKETFKHSTHGGSGTRLYRIWRSMRERCYRTGAVNYKWYGGKGIGVCETWNSSFEAFRDWALSNGYSDNLTIDRVNSELGYTPENCRWITRQENASIAAKEMQAKRKGN